MGCLGCCVCEDEGGGGGGDAMGKSYALVSARVVVGGGVCDCCGLGGVYVRERGRGGMAVERSGLVGMTGTVSDSVSVRRVEEGGSGFEGG